MTVQFPPWMCPQHGVELSGNKKLFCEMGCVFESINGVYAFVDTDNYADSFGLQWNTHRLTQLDSFSGLPISRDRLARCFGESAFADVGDKLILEAGCGAGRFTEILVDRGAAVLSLDLSSAVFANAETSPVSHSHRIARADLNNAPVANDTFDVVMCLGVLQHTVSPEQSIRSLCEKVRPGGLLIIDHYSFDWKYYCRLFPVWRQIIKRLSPERALQTVTKLVEWFWPLHIKFKDSRVRGFLLSRISPVLHYLKIYPELSDGQQLDWAILDTHDALTDWYKHFRWPRDIEKILTECNMKIEYLAEAGNGVEARATKS